MMIFPTSPKEIETLRIVLGWRKKYPKMFEVDRIQATIERAGQYADYSIEAREMKEFAAKAERPESPNDGQVCQFAARSWGASTYEWIRLRGE